MPDLFVMTATAVTATATVTLVNSGSNARNVVRSIQIHNNHSANTAAVTIYVTRGSTATAFTIVRYTQVDAYESLQPLSQPLVLGLNDTLLVSANPVNDVHIVVSRLEIT